MSACHTFGQSAITYLCHVQFGAEHSSGRWDSGAVGYGPWAWQGDSFMGMHINSECIKVSAPVHGCWWLGYWSSLAAIRGGSKQQQQQLQRRRSSSNTQNQHPTSEAELLSKHQDLVSKYTEKSDRYYLLYNIQFNNLLFKCSVNLL